MIRIKVGLGLVVGALPLFLPPLLVAQQDFYWPMPGHEDDIRGTYADYRPDPPIFHPGIDIHAPEGTPVYPLMDELKVDYVLFSPNSGATIRFLQLYGGAEYFVYAHIADTYTYGTPIIEGQIISGWLPYFWIWDLDQDNNSENDHLHLDLGGPTRNPLWANDNPYRELETADDDVTPPTIESVILCRFDGPSGKVRAFFGCSEQAEPHRVPSRGEMTGTTSAILQVRCSRAARPTRSGCLRPALSTPSNVTFSSSPSATCPATPCGTSTVPGAARKITQSQLSAWPAVRFWWCRSM
jgi:hypothetical protein